MNLIFEECNKKGYAPRTAQNILETHGTLAIAVDFDSAGEKLTHRLCEKYKKPYLAIRPTGPETILNVEKVGNWIIQNKIEKLNIAGNGIYTFSKHNPAITQNACNVYMSMLLESILNKFDITLDLIQSGGQTGIDEAGIMAGISLNIPCKIVAPNGWTFRDGNGRDLKDEILFKKRFKKWEI